MEALRALRDTLMALMVYKVLARPQSLVGLHAPGVSAVSADRLGLAGELGKGEEYVCEAVGGHPRDGVAELAGLKVTGVPRKTRQTWECAKGAPPALWGMECGGLQKHAGRFV